MKPDLREAHRRRGRFSPAICGASLKLGSRFTRTMRSVVFPRDLRGLIEAETYR